MLLTNADKYCASDQPIEISAYIEGHCLKVTVTDYGPGIPDNQKESIFSRFERLEHGDKVAHRGWGLGLYFAKVMTEAQGGNLTLQSPVHQDVQHPGSCFTITLPLTEDVPEDA